MNRQEYMRQLEAALARITAEEREAALEYYNEYFDEAGPENEENVMNDLGSPQKLASQIKAESAARYLEQDGQPTVKKGVSSIWLVVLGFFAAPIALPLAIAAAAVVFSVVMVILCLLFAAGLVVVALFLVGIALVIAGFVAMASGPATGLCLVGIGISITGGMLLAGVLAVLATAAFLRFLGRSLSRALSRRNKENGQKEVLRDE